MMSAQIMGRKTQAAAKLTPVKGEVTPTHVATTEAPLAGPAPASVPFPYDQPDMVKAAIADAERNASEVIRQMTFVLDGIAALKQSFDVKPGETVAPVKLEDERKKREQAADEAAREREAIQSVETDEQAEFEANVEAKSQAAQAATFREPSAAAVNLAEDMGANPDEGWFCPEHGTYEVKTSRGGREFRICPDCDLFERL